MESEKHSNDLRATANNRFAQLLGLGLISWLLALIFFGSWKVFRFKLFGIFVYACDKSSNCRKAALRYLQPYCDSAIIKQTT